jgi:hypothetical protein
LVLLKEIVKDNSICVMQEKESYIKENYKSEAFGHDTA